MTVDHRETCIEIFEAVDVGSSCRTRFDRRELSAVDLLRDPRFHLNDLNPLPEPAEVSVRPVLLRQENLISFVMNVGTTIQRVQPL